MAAHITNTWTYAVCYMEVRRAHENVAVGSGFFWKHGQRTFLVTNWHNLAARNPRQANDGSVAPPDRVGFAAFLRVEPPDEKGDVTLLPTAIDAPLLDGTGQALWQQHPTLGRRADVAAIDITDILASQPFEVGHANLLDGDADVEPRPSQDAFVVGFPLGLVTGIPIPVWKRATIATEPSYNPDGLPIVYVDAATRQGMSGAVVLARHILVGSYLRRDGSRSNTIYAQRDQVLGIYSGRVHPHHVEAQLGVVWKRSTVEETVAGGRRADLS
jgi:hypothetical protein